MRFSVADLATNETQRAISAHLEALHRADGARMVVFTWWAGDEQLDRQEAPSHLLYDILPMVPGATHLTIEERQL